MLGCFPPISPSCYDHAGVETAIASRADPRRFVAWGATDHWPTFNRGQCNAVIRTANTVHDRRPDRPCGWYRRFTLAGVAGNVGACQPGRVADKTNEQQAWLNATRTSRLTVTVMLCIFLPQKNLLLSENSGDFSNMQHATETG